MAKTESQNMYLFFCKARTNPNDVNNVSLDNADICKVFSAQCLQVFLFTISLFLLLSKALMARSKALKSDKNAFVKIKKTDSWVAIGLNSTVSSV